jgi:hypothetical protein
MFGDAGEDVGQPGLRIDKALMGDQGLVVGGLGFGHASSAISSIISICEEGHFRYSHSFTTLARELTRWTGRMK